MRKYIFFFLLIPLFIYLLFSPGEAVRASAKGVDLWFHTVLPALLPFIILSGILVRSGILLPIFRKADKIFRIFPGLSGAGVYALVRNGSIHVRGISCSGACLCHLPGDILRNRNPAVRSSSSRSADDASAGRSVFRRNFHRCPDRRHDPRIRSAPLSLPEGQTAAGRPGSRLYLTLLRRRLNHPRQRLYHPAPAEPPGRDPRQRPAAAAPARFCFYSRYRSSSAENR